MIVETYYSRGAHLHFEPPIETGEVKIRSLEQLMAVAALGPEASPLLRQTLAGAIAPKLDQHNNEPLRLAVAASMLLEPKHKMVLDESQRPDW